MDVAHALIDTSVTPSLPAPAWFIELFKVLGFSLHAAGMNLWYAGVVVAMLLAWRGNEHGRRFAARLMTQMPVVVAMGVNFGIVPLLFLQAGYAEVFYPATVLMAWFWFAIILLLIPAYYGIYVYAFGLHGESPMTTWRQAAGWGAALLFLSIGFLFANGLSLLENVRAWPELWEKHSYYGAATGTALNLADARFWPRWLLMFGLALTTTGAWVAFDAGWFARRESPQYRDWAKHFSLKLYTLGVVWFLAAGAWYTFFTWPTEVQEAMFEGPRVVLTVLTVAAPALPWLLIWRTRRRGDVTPGGASLIGLAQFGVLGVNAVSRHVVQHLGLVRTPEGRPYFDIASLPTSTQWSAVALFLVSFAVGLAVIAWMLAQVVKLPPQLERSDGERELIGRAAGDDGHA
jgi:hypothetical protein